MHNLERSRMPCRRTAHLPHMQGSRTCNRRPPFGLGHTSERGKSLVQSLQVARHHHPTPEQTFARPRAGGLFGDPPNTASSADAAHPMHMIHPFMRAKSSTLRKTRTGHPRPAKPHRFSIRSRYSSDPSISIRSRCQHQPSTGCNIKLRQDSIQDCPPKEPPRQDAMHSVAEQTRTSPRTGTT